MIKIIMMLSLLSCYGRGIKRLSSLFKRCNTNIENRIEYKVGKNAELRGENSEILYKLKSQLIYIKDLNEEKLIVKDENYNTLAILENKKLTLKSSNISIPSPNGTIELIYNIFLYSSLELNKILQLLEIKDYKINEIDLNLVKVSFKDGYMIYDKKNKVIKEISNIMYDNNIKFENKMVFTYKMFNRMLLLDKFILESKTQNNFLIVEEIIR